MSEPLTLDGSLGVLRLGPTRYLLLRPETLMEIQKGVEDRLGLKSSEYIYAAGAAWAVALCRQLRSAQSEPPALLAQRVCQHATTLGWGNWQVAAWQPEERLLSVRVAGSPFAEAYGASDRPVCHLICGAIAGMAESLLSMQVGCAEQGCRAQGQPECLFVATGQDVAGKEAWDW